MKKIILIVFLSIITVNSFGQSGLYKKKPTLSINFILNDFVTAERIRKTSLSSVFINKTLSKFKEMSPGLSIKYFEGVSNHLDFAASLDASTANFTFKNGKNPGSDKFLLEADASFIAKLLSDKFVVNPYITAGAGISLYSVYWGAYIPLGFGLQFRLAENTFLNTQLQYRTGITDQTSNHLNYSLGFATPIGVGKKN